ncbi:MAG: hypothetical protein HY059_23015 [Proteobacteria bacterium]|nr:hypothetical protein [Pseudomonadota bacterium]
MGDPIRHVVVLMLENHSFDQMLGCFQSVYPKLEGIDPKAPPRVNKDKAGREYKQEPTTERNMTIDPMHEVASVSRQIMHENGGFVRDLDTGVSRLLFTFPVHVH